MSRVSFYRDGWSKWHWRVTADNGAILANSGEGYKRRADCERGAVLTHGVMANSRVLLHLAVGDPIGARRAAALADKGVRPAEPERQPAGRQAVRIITVPRRKVKR